MSTIEILVLILAVCLVAAVAALILRGRGGDSVVDALAESEYRQQQAAERLAAMQSELA